MARKKTFRVWRNGALEQVRDTRSEAESVVKAGKLWIVSEAAKWGVSDNLEDYHFRIQEC